MKMNKPLIAVATVALAAALAVPGIALAAGNGNGVCQQQCANGECAVQANFIDEDGDGICDNQGQNCQNGEGCQYGQKGAGQGNCNGIAQHLRAHDGTGNGAQKRNCQ